MFRTGTILKQTLLKNLTNRQKLGIPPLPLDLGNVNDLCSIIKNKDYAEKDLSFLVNQLTHRVTPGVDETSYIKANFLKDICYDTNNLYDISKKDAIKILGTMQGGYNVNVLTQLLDHEDLAKLACDELKDILLIFDDFNVIQEKYKKGNVYAKELLESWANGEWFLKKDKVADNIPLIVFKVSGEINTDDLSPAVDAWSRPDIPLHSLSMLKTPRDDIEPDVPFELGPINLINELKKKGKVVFVGDVVGTGSSRKSATNSIIWHFGDNIPYVPNKKQGGFCFGGKIAPIFFNTMEDSGAFPIELNVDKFYTGQEIILRPYDGNVLDNTGNVISNFNLSSESLLDSVRANGRINLIIGKNLTFKAKKVLNLATKNIFVENKIGKTITKFSLAQKIVGKACNVPGISPGTYCEPVVTSVGSQDTTGPMTRNELKDLACLGFSADLVMQSFCHTAAYPKPIDIVTQSTLPVFMHNRGGISLKPGDGIIHSWLNRMLLPDTIGTGGDSHTRFPIGISFPAGSGLVAFAAATGMMPLEMPESVLVRFSGEMQPGITLRDIVHAIPYIAIKNGLLTIVKKNKKNIFNGRILEIEGLPNLTCEQAFELSDASAERSAAGCTIKLNKEPVIEYLESNITLLKWMINEGYEDKISIQRRIDKMEEWIKNPILLEADDGAEYAEIIDINLNEIKEPILCAPNDPDKAVTLSDVAGENIDEVFIGSCMTNIGHFRAAGKLLNSYEGQLNTKLWIAPPTKMDEKKLIEEGFYSIYGKVGARTETPGCSLCMGNQARVADKSKVLSTSTRNFPNRLGKGADVYLASAELSAITAIEGKIPDYETYMEYFNKIEKDRKDIFNYLNFHKLDDYKKM